MRIDPAATACSEKHVCLFVRKCGYVLFKLMTKKSSVNYSLDLKSSNSNSIFYLMPHLFALKTAFISLLLPVSPL